MQRFYKVFLVILLVIIAVNLYAFDYRSEIMSEDNSKVVFSVATAIIGLILLYVMHTWSKIGVKK